MTKSELILRLAELRPHLLQRDAERNRADAGADDQHLIVRVAEAGICGSDLHMVANGMAPVVMGHEFGGHLVDGTLAVYQRVAGRSADSQSANSA